MGQGPVIIEVNNSKYVLGREISYKIFVKYEKELNDWLRNQFPQNL